MSDIVIKAENIGKKYVIGHQTQNPKNATLRDSLISGAQNFWRKTKDLVTGKPIIMGDTQEEVWALRDVDFEIRQGEAVGIIGRNGAGKSTLLKILSRITEPTTGRIAIKGRVASLLEVGTGFHSELTGRENIYLNGTILGMTRAEIKRKFDEIVAFAEIDKYLDTPVKRYSSGMYVRLAFAVAAHLEPEILVVDEVLAVGDAEFQKKCLGKMGAVSKGGRTVLFVSHNMTAIHALCDRSILMDEGQIRCDGSSKTVIAEYLSSNLHTGGRQSSGKFDLSKRNNKYLPDHLIVQSLYLADMHGNHGDVFPMGQAMQMCVDVTGMSDYRNAQIAVIIKSQSDQWICTITSGMSCTHIDEPRAKRERAILSIPKIPLLPGTYWMDITIAQPGIGRLDYVERAGRFTVAEADVYGTGYQLSDYFGLIYLESSWKILYKT